MKTSNSGKIIVNNKFKDVALNLASAKAATEQGWNNLPVVGAGDIEYNLIINDYDNRAHHKEIKSCFEYLKRARNTYWLGDQPTPK